MMFKKDKLADINARFIEMRVEKGFSGTGGFYITNSLLVPTIVYNGMGICDIDKIQDVICGLEMIRDAIAEETGLVGL